MNNLLTQLDVYMPDVYKLGTKKGDYKDKLMLILINYKPIKKYIGSTCYYAFLNIATQDIVYRKRVSHRVSNIPTRHWCDIPETLQTLYKDYEEHPELTELALTQDINLDFSKFIYETEEIEGMFHSGCIQELNAIGLKTQSFNQLEQIVNQRINNRVNIMGVEIPQQIQQTNGNWVNALDIITKWYYGYMLEANIDLADIYWNSLAQPRSTPEIARIKLLNEFVPLLFKFDDVFNPIFDKGIYNLSVWDRIKDRYPIIRKAFKVNPLCICNGSRHSNDTESFGMFTTRGFLSKIFGINIAPKEGNSPELFSLKYYSTTLFNIILTGAGIDFNLVSKTTKWYVVSRVINEEDMIIDITNMLSNKHSSVSAEAFEVDLEDALIYQYLLYTDPGNTVQWYKDNVQLRKMNLQKGQNLVNYMSKDLGGDYLGKSQSIIN